MNNKNIKKTNNEYTKENRELGESFLEVSDFQKRREKKVALIKENIKEKHYLEQLTRVQGELHKVYAIFTEKIKNHPLLKNKISENLIRHIFRDLRFSKHLHKKNISTEEIGIQIVDEISKKISFNLVIFPLDGFIPDNGFLKLGNVVFGTAKDILEYFNFKLENKKILNNTFENNFLRTVSVGTSVTTFDKNSALIIAENRINQALNFIRIFIPIEYNLRRQPKIRIYDENKERYIFPLPFREFNRVLPQYDSLHTAIISNSLLGKFKTKKILEEGKRILQKESHELSELDKRILNSLGWIGEGIDSNEFYLKVVKCVVGLETLFKLGQNKMEEFCDQIIKIFNKKPTDTKKIRKDSKKLYKLRSEIVHGGKRDISEEDAECAECLASGCLLFILDKRNELGSDKALFEWLKKDKRTSLRKVFLTLVKRIKRNWRVVNRKSRKQEKGELSIPNS